MSGTTPGGRPEDAIVAGSMKLERRHVGYFDRPDQSDPVQPIASRECVVCGDEWYDGNVCSIGVMALVEPRTLSLFYRTHRTCMDSLSGDQKYSLDQQAMDVWKL